MVNTNTTLGKSSPVSLVLTESETDADMFQINVLCRPNITTYQDTENYILLDVEFQRVEVSVKVARVLQLAFQGK